MTAEIPQEAVERAIALVRRMACHLGELGSDSPTFAEARAIVAMLPEPVDLDEEEAKAIAFANGYGRCSSSHSTVRLLTRTLKRGRELALKARAVGEGS